MDLKVDSLIEASKRGDETAVKQLIRDGVDLNAKEVHGNHAIHFAAIMGRNNVIATLLNTGEVCINSEGSYNRTALHCAVRNEHLSTAEFLLLKNADCTAIDDNGSTPLHYAFYRFKNCCIQTERNECNCSEKLEGCTSLCEILDQWPVSFSKKCVFLAVAEMMITQGNSDITMINKKGELALEIIPSDFCDTSHLKSYFGKLSKISVPLPKPLRDFIKQTHNEMTALKLSKSKHYEELLCSKDEEIEKLKAKNTDLQTTIKKRDEEIMNLKKQIHTFNVLIETNGKGIEKTAFASLQVDENIESNV